MAKEEIEKLREKVEKDPLSKLFVPLAEEYRKIGMLDEAVSVLLKGLENQPNYMTARVALGKIYLEKKMLKEAKEEFKKVITAIPDNLFALKKIAEISAELGEISDAIDAYQKIVRLNPLDEEAKVALEDLRSKKIEKEVPEPPSSKPVDLPRPEPKSEKEEPEHFEIEGFMPVSQTSFSEDEFEKFKNEFYSKETLHEEIPEPTEHPKVEIPPTFTDEQETRLEEVQEISEEDFFIETPEIEVEESTMSLQPVESVPESEVISPAESTAPEKIEPDFSYPDSLIQQGNYVRAIEVYKKMLADYPGDRRIIQRLEELKAFLKILGKGNELVIQQLSNFLEAIKKRKDEFLRNP